MRSRFPVVLAVLCAAIVACAGETSDVDALEQALREEYPGAQFEVSLTEGSHHLELMVDTAVYGNYRLDNFQRRTLGEAMARLALEHVGAAADLDSISIDFIQERSGAWLWKGWSMLGESFAVAGLR